MIWGKTCEDRREERTAWHRWFAWHQVQMQDCRWVWLQWIRRRRYLPIGFYDTIPWEYRLQVPFDF